MTLPSDNVINAVSAANGPSLRIRVPDKSPTPPLLGVPFNMVNEGTVNLSSINVPELISIMILTGTL